MKGHVASLVGVCVLTLAILVYADVTPVDGRGGGAGSGGTGSGGAGSGGAGSGGAGSGGAGSGGAGGSGSEGTGGAGGGGAGTAGTGAGAAAAGPGDAAGVGDGTGVGDTGGTAANTNPIGNWMRTFAEVEPASPTPITTTTVVVTPEGRQIVIEGIDHGFPAAFPATGTTRPFYSGIGTCPDLDYRTDTRCFETP